MGTSLIVFQKKYFKALALDALLLLCLLPFASAQNKTVTGKVTDSRDGLALRGASITVKKFSTGTETDSNGNFSLTMPLAVKTVMISATGFSSREISVAGNNNTNIQAVLNFSYAMLNEVVLVGYGVSQRKDITGAITHAVPKEFNSGVITNPLQQIQGKIAGLVITQPGGDPNSDIIVRLRGATSIEGQPPLLVIDGVAIDDFYKSITTLNPADIESFDILKDASAAAIYGSRGANGVILVATKKGKPGKTAIDYNGFVAAETISKEIKVLDAAQWRKATGDSSALDKHGNTDWQKAIAQTGISHSHTMGISGGSNEMNYRGSISYTKQQGVIINTSKEVITARLNVNQKSLQNKLEINYGINASVVNRALLPYQSSTSQSRNGGGDLFFSHALATIPVVPIYNPDGSFYQGSDLSIQTPVYTLKQKYSSKRENFFQGAVKADYELFKGLKAGASGALSRGNDVYDFFSAAVPGTNQTSVAAKANDNKQDFSGDLHANFHKKYGKHNIDITGVYEYNKFINDGFSVLASGYLIPELLNNNMGAATQVLASNIPSYKNETRLISFLGRAVYNYNDQYIITANIRRDGSSKFGPNHSWGNFPSVSVAWRVNEAFFFKNIAWLNNLKLRVSYGLTGNQENLAPYPYQLLYGPLTPYLYNGQFLQSYGIVQQDNPDLKWEVRKSFNLGADFSIFNDRVNGTIDIFNDRTNDMLYQYNLSQPPFLFNTVTANAANAINGSVEVAINASVIRNKKFQWNVSFNLATLKSRITNLSGKFEGAVLALTGDEQHYGYAQGSGYSGAYISQLKAGYAAGVFWIPQYAGLDASGHELYKNYDLNGKLTGISNSYTDQDRIFIDPSPHFTWGFTNTFTLGNFDGNIFFRGVQGQKIFANTLMSMGAVGYLPGSNVTEKALTSGFNYQPQPTDYWLKDGSYTRLENLTVGYHFKKIRGISNLRLYLSGSNLFVITKYDGIDPEISTDGTQRYIDNNYYPKTRGFVLGANLVF
ncbi:MAG: SusC/RagA family TonB-linked outer membrane protein [Bacteroidota bacterium]